MSIHNPERFDDLLTIAVSNISRQEIKSFDELDSSNTEISPAFDRKMERLLKRKKPAIRKKRIKTIVKNVLVACLLLLSALSLIGMAVPTVREAFAEAVIEFYEKYFDVNIKVGDTEIIPDNIVEKREPTYFPDGYDHKEVIRDKSSVYEVLYFDKNLGGKDIYYIQKCLKDWNVSVDNKDCVVSEIKINGYDGKLFEYDLTEQPNIVIWSDSEYGYMLNAYCEKDEIIKIAESVQ